MTDKEALKKRLAELEDEARATDPELYDTMQRIKELTPEERNRLADYLEAELKRRRAARA